MANEMVARKGGTLHRRAGWVFVGAMAIVSVTALVLAGSRLLFAATPGQCDGGLFLLFVALLTASAVSAGVRVLRFKNRTAAHLHWWDTGPPALLAVSSAGLAAYDLGRGEVLFVGFAAIGAVSAAGSLRYWLRAPSIVGAPAIAIWTVYCPAEIFGNATSRDGDTGGPNSHPYLSSPHFPWR